VVAATHDDYPALVAEALDQLAAQRLSMPATAALLGVSASQLAGLFRKEPQAWTVLNRLRAAAGIPGLK
jgi:AraC-like DNA-binding protein